MQSIRPCGVFFDRGLLPQSRTPTEKVDCLNSSVSGNKMFFANAASANSCVALVDLVDTPRREEMLHTVLGAQQLWHQRAVPKVSCAQRSWLTGLFCRCEGLLCVIWSEFRAAGLMRQSTGKEVAKRSPHVVVKWFPNIAFCIMCKNKGGGKEVAERRPLSEGKNSAQKRNQSLSLLQKLCLPLMR